MALTNHWSHILLEERLCKFRGLGSFKTPSQLDMTVCQKYIGRVHSQIGHVFRVREESRRTKDSNLEFYILNRSACHYNDTNA